MIFVPKRQRGFFTPMPLDSRFKVDGASFDGANDWLTRGAGLTAAADATQGIFSTYIRADGGTPGTTQRLLAVSGSVGGAPANGIRVATYSNFSAPSNRGITVTLYDSSGTIIYQFTSAFDLVVSTWTHILISWDMSVPVAHLYMDGVSRKNATLTTGGTVDYTFSDWSVGAGPDGTSKLNACIGEYYFAPAQFLDFSVAANVTKFRRSDGRPSYLARNGSLPTGTAPLVYFHLDKGEAVANFATNRGTGGNFTVTGALTTASTSPSD